MRFMMEWVWSYITTNSSLLLLRCYPPRTACCQPKTNASFPLLLVGLREGEEDSEGRQSRATASRRGGLQDNVSRVELQYSAAPN
eukprot:scaffold2028_cov181-Ochromonas_danica.AAC.10